MLDEAEWSRVLSSEPMVFEVIPFLSLYGLVFLMRVSVYVEEDFIDLL